MFLSFLVGCAFTQDRVAASPPWSEALGRPLSWDTKGAYAFGVDQPITKASREIIDNLMAAELGRAESLARFRIKNDPNDLVPAWILGQILRVRKQALSEYRQNVQNELDSGASVPVLLYRFHVCRLAQPELPIKEQGIRGVVWRELDQRLKRLREQLRPAARRRLGVAIALTQSNVFWAVANREILEAYRKANPKGPEVRPLICQAYLSGVGYERKPNFELPPQPDEIKPEIALALAKELLAERPQDALGHYYLGLSYTRLDRPDLAFAEMKKALETGGLPPAYQQGAQAYLVTRNRISLRVEVPY